MAELLLGLDIGTASSRAVLARADGLVVASAQQPHKTSIPRPGQAEHDAERIWWQDLRLLCEAVLSPQTRGSLAAICISGIGPCLLPCDERLRPLRPAILYGIDRRAEAEIAELNERYGEDEILARCGSALSSQAIGPKLLWLRRHESEVWARTAGWYMASSFLVARLTGEYVLDHHSASQCDPMYDLAAGGWAEDWAEELSAGVALPRLVWPTEIVGEVSAEAARASGLPAGVPVLAGTIDAWAEARSVGVRRPGDAMLMYGSTMFLVAVTAAPLVHPKLWGTVGVHPGSRCVAAGMATSGALAEWARELLGDGPVEELVAAAANAPPGGDGLLTLPYFAGERSPIFDPHARGVIAGLTLSHGRAEIARSIYEGTAFGARHNLETMATAGAAPERIVAVGGGASGDFWPQLVSDVTGAPQLLPVHTIGASYGDALLAGIGLGWLDGDADWTVARRTLEPRAQHRALYDRLYELYRELYPATLSISHDLARLQNGGVG